MRHIDLRLLGPPSILVNGKRARVSRRRALALLSFLVCERRLRARQALASLFWPDASPSAARTSLRRALADLNAILGKGWLKEDDDAIEVNPKFSVRTDLGLLENDRAGNVSDVALLDSSMQLARAPFMEGLSIPGLDAWEEWRFMQAQAVKRLQRDVAQRATATAWKQGDVARALQWTTIWLGLDDLDERAFRAHLRALARAGRADRLAFEYKLFQTRLQLELGIQPDAETRELVASLRAPESVIESAHQAAQPITVLRYVDVDGL